MVATSSVRMMDSFLEVELRNQIQQLTAALREAESTIKQVLAGWLLGSD